MKKYIGFCLVSIVLIMTPLLSQAQNPSAIVEFESTEKGILIPRMRGNEILGIVSPAEGLMVYNTDTHQFYYHNGTSWQTYTTGPIGPDGVGVDSVSAMAGVAPGTVEVSFYLTDMSIHKVLTPNIKGDRGERGAPGVGIAQTISLIQDSIVLSDGGGKVRIDTSNTNELQTISRSGLNVSLSDGGSYQDSVLSEAEVGLMVGDDIRDSISTMVMTTLKDTSQAIRTDLSVNVVKTTALMDSIGVHRDALTVLFASDTSSTNELQTISRIGKTVSLTDGGSYQDSVLTESDVDGFVSGDILDSMNVVRTELADTSAMIRTKTTALMDSIGIHRSDLTTLFASDTSATNELQSISLISDSLTLSDGGGKVRIDMSNTNELQTISRSGLTVTLSDGGSYQDSVLSESAVDSYVSGDILDSMNVVRAELADTSAMIRTKTTALMDSIGIHRSELTTLYASDTSATNELQSISLISDSLTLSAGGGKVRIDTSSTNEKITGFGIIGDSLYIKEGSMDTMKLNLREYIQGIIDESGGSASSTESFLLNNAIKYGAKSLIDSFNYTIPQLVSSGVDTSELIEAGLLDSLLSGGATYMELKNSTGGVSASKFIKGGGRIDSLLGAGYSIASLLSGGAERSSFYGIEQDSGIIFWLHPSNDGTGLAAALADEGIMNWYNARITCQAKTTGGHSWQLPRLPELDLAYKNLHLASLGSFSDSSYWSSTEYDFNNAWFQYFPSGAQSIFSKVSISFVRCVRGF